MTDQHVDSTPSEIYLRKLIASAPIQGGGAVPLSYAVFQLLLEHQNSRSLSGDLLEFGVWHGNTLALLATASLKGEAVFGIDISEHWLNAAKVLTASECEKVHVNPIIKLIHGSSTLPGLKEIIRNEIGPAGIRFAHIDAEHSRELVLSDAKAILPMMAPWGIICFDDCFSLACPGVAEAFFQLASDTEWIPILFTPNKAYLCNRRYVKSLRDYIVNIPQILYDRHSITASMSCSSYYPDDGHISIFQTNEQFYQVVNMQHKTIEEFLAYRPRSLDIATCKLL
jgi:hypothetical protein